MQSTKIAHLHTAGTQYYLPHYQHRVRGTLVTSMNLQWQIIIVQSLHFIPGFTLAVLHTMGFDKCITTCVHCYDIIQNDFTALKFLRASSLLTTADLFTVSTVVPRPERHVVEITWYVALWDWLLHSVNINLSLLHLSIRLLKDTFVAPSFASYE